MTLRAESRHVEKLAEWLYNRDAKWLVRESWADENEGPKDVYRAQARQAFRFIGPSETDKRGLSFEEAMRRVCP